MFPEFRIRQRAGRSAAWLTAMVVTIAAVIIHGQPPATGRVATGLAAHYPLDDGSGRAAASKVAAPSLQLVATVNWIAGRNGVSFAGTSEPFGRPASLVVEPPDTLRDAVSATNTFTCEIWYQSTEPSRILRAGFASLTDAEARNFSVEAGADSTRVHLATTGVSPNDRLAFIAPRTPSNALEHLVVTYDQTAVTLYRNGARVTSALRAGTFSLWEPSQPFMVGSLPGSPPWRGQVYQVALYSRALSVAEVTQNFQAGSSPVPLISEVRGRVVDPAGRPVSGANIIAEFATSPGAVARTVTANDGSFLLRLAEGPYRLCVTRGGVAVCARQFQAVGSQPVDVGAIPISVDPGDFDGDGLSDDLETSGWVILVDERGDGKLTERLVKSDPNETDTDQDGLSDRFEFAMKTDPRSKDSDGDLLSDKEELDEYKSNPVSVDTDGDARGPKGDKQPNPGLFDGIELLRSGTSPTLADTDGDGLTDYDEILGGGFNPLRADLPEWSLQPVGNPSITLNVTTKTTSGRNSVTSQLQRDQASQSQTDNTATKQSIENTQTISAEAEVSGPPFGGSLKVSASAEFKQGLVNESSASFTRDSVRESQKTFQDELQEVTEQEYKDGEVQVAMRFRNTSELSFKMKDLSVVAFRLAPQVSGSFSVVGVLKPETTGSVVLGPGTDHLFVAKATSLNAIEVSRLMRNPSSLLFEVGGFSVFQTDVLGNEVKDYAVVAQDVVERCGLIVIDYEDGRVERHFVATNVHRHPDGAGQGVQLADALQKTLGLSVRTMKKGSQQEILSQIRDVRQFGEAGKDKPRGYWTVIGNGRDFEPDNSGAAPSQSKKDFSKIVLRAGERVSLVYVSDADADGLSLREERLLGTDPTRKDSDSDGISDFEETKVGWTVNLFAENGLPVADLARKVFSDPRFPDADRDGLTDAQEKALGTDPNDPDTDKDRINDRDDPKPLQAPGNLNLPTSGLLTHYKFDRSDQDLVSGTVRDGVGAFDLTATSDRFFKGYSGTVFSLSSPSTGLFDYGDRHTNALRRAVYFSQLGSSPDEKYSVAEARFEVIPIGKAFTVAAWINPQKLSGRSDFGVDGTILEQEGWASLFVEKRTGATASAVHFGMTTSSAPAVLSDCAAGCLAPPEGKWSFYAAVYDGGRMSLYRNGALVAGPTPVTAIPKTEWVTKPFFRIGASARTTVPTKDNCQFSLRQGDFKLCQPGFQGAFDDFRIFNRALRAEEVRELYIENGFAGK